MDGSPSHDDPPVQPAQKRRRNDSLSSTSSPHELGQMRRGRGGGSTTFVGSGSGIHFIRTVRQAFAQNNQKSTDEAVDDELVVGEDDRLDSQSPRASLWHLDEVILNNLDQDTAQHSFSFEDMTCWTRSYFEFWHPPFPFLNAPNVLEIFEKASVKGFLQLTHLERVVIQSIMSIALADRRQMPKQEMRLVPQCLIFRSIDDALSSLQPIISRPSSILALQAVVAVQVFLISMLRLNAASRIGGFIVRMAQQIGLHRCPTRYKQFSTDDIEIRRRLWFSIYCLERYLSQSLGLPLDIKDDDLDVCYPDDEQHPLSTSQYYRNTRAKSSYDLRILLPTILSKHGQIKGMILELRNKAVLSRRTDPEELSRVDAEIAKWWNEAQDLVEPSYMEDIPDGIGNLTLLKPSHKILLIIQKHESIILLNRPVITSGHKTSAFSAALQKCIGASKAIISNMYRHLNEWKVDGQNTGRINNPLFWPGFCWSVWMSALILLYAASEGHYPARIAQREADRCIIILEHLFLRGNFWPGACATAIKELQIALNHKTQASPSADMVLASHNAQLRTERPTHEYDLGSYRTSQRGVSLQASNPLHRPGNNSSIHEKTQASSSQANTESTTLAMDQTSSSQNGSRRDFNHPSPASTSYISADRVGDYNPNSNNAYTPNVQQQQQSTGNISNFNLSSPIGMGQLPTSTGTGNADFWSENNNQFGYNQDQLDSFDGIFQLMDVSYLLAGQSMGEHQPELVENFAYPSIVSHSARSNPLG